MKNLICLFVVTLFISSLRAEEPRTVKITLSPETTFIMEPQLPDGRIDYYEAVNRITSEGVRPENNLVVGLFQLVPGEYEYPMLRIDKNIESMQLYREKYWKKLGFDAPPPIEKLEFLDPGTNLPGRNFRKELLEAYSEEQLAPQIQKQKDRERRYSKERLEAKKIDQKEYDAELKKLDEETPDSMYRQIVNDEWYEAMKKVWTEKDFPYLARWIPSTDELTRKLIDVSKRTDYYGPIISHDESQDLSAAPLPYVQGARQVARFLQYRGNWDFGRKNFDQAFECALSSVRMGRTMRKGAGFVIEDLVGIAMEGVGCSQITMYLADPRLTQNADWLLAKKREFDAIHPTIGPIAVPPKWSRCERLGALASVQLLAFDPAYFLNECDADGTPVYAFIKAYYDSKPDCDWDKILRFVNSYCDETEDNLTIPEFQRRFRSMERLEKRTQDYLKNHVEKKSDRDEHLAQCFVLNAFAARSSIVIAEARAEWSHRITSLAFSLGAYRADHEGKNPETLNELVPKYIDAVPVSPFTDRPMRYLKRAKDILIANDDYFKLDGSEPDVEKRIADAPAGGSAFPDARHFVFVVHR